MRSGEATVHRQRNPAHCLQKDATVWKGPGHRQRNPAHCLRNVLIDLQRILKPSSPTTEPGPLSVGGWVGKPPFIRHRPAVLCRMWDGLPTHPPTDTGDSNQRLRTQSTVWTGMATDNGTRPTVWRGCEAQTLLGPVEIKFKVYYSCLRFHQNARHYLRWNRQRAG